MKYNCVIIDDDAHSIDYLSGLISAATNLQLISSFQNPIDALNGMNKEQDIDILFIDIVMGQVSCLDLIPAIRKLVKYIIIVSAHSKYAINAFEVRADHFLLKPYNELRFFTVLNHVIKESPERKFENADRLIYIKGLNKNTFVQIAVDAILIIEAAKNYINFHTKTGIIIGYHTMKDMLDALRVFPGFLRVHKSFIVNTKYITKIETDNLIMENSLMIPIGESHRTALRSFVKERTVIGKRR